MGFCEPWTRSCVVGPEQWWSGLVCFLSLTHLHTMTRTSSINTSCLLTGRKWNQNTCCLSRTGMLVGCDIFVHMQDGLLCSTAVSNISLLSPGQASSILPSRRQEETVELLDHTTRPPRPHVNVIWLDSLISHFPWTGHLTNIFWASKLLSNFSVVSHSIAFLLWQQKPSAFRLMV